MATLGLDSEYDSIFAYIKKVTLSQKNSFLSAFRKHVRAIEAGEEDNDRVKASWAAQLKEDYEETNDIESKSSAFKANKQFIEEKHWKPEYGTYTQDQVTTEFIFGEWRRGRSRGWGRRGRW